uniref:Serine/threonine-protein phosphatase n=1 Tax=Strongyloides papillosus TaxID=174720 RepID=A0A0N5BB34_STREA
MGEKYDENDKTASERKGFGAIISKIFDSKTNRSENENMDSPQMSGVNNCNDNNKTKRVFTKEEREAIEMEKETLRLLKIQKYNPNTCKEACHKNVDKLIERHMNWNRELAVFYYYDEIDFILSQMIDVFKSINTLVETDGPIIVCGDIHGQLVDLLRIFKKFGMPAKQKYIFLGDYVDRGNNSIEVINLLFLLKLKYKDKVHLLRGNHELQHINKVYGFYEELSERFDDECLGEDVYMRYNDIFRYLPLAGCIGGKILCMHGGMSDEIVTLDCIRNISRPLTSVTGIACDLLWADPDDTITDVTFNNNRGVSIKFGNNALDSFCSRLNLDLIIRGHQVCPIGFALFNNGKLITVFSASDYDEDMKNLAGVVYITKTSIIPISIKCPKIEKEKDPLIRKQQKIIKDNCFKQQNNT